MQITRNHKKMTTMKYFYTYLAIVLLGTGFVSAQTGIGTKSPNPDAMLEVNATDKGLLLPRIALTGTANAAPLGGHVAGMTVYNTATTGDVRPGYYISDGAQWLRITSVEDVIDLIDSTETVTNLVDNGDGTVTYTNEAGTAQTVDIADIITQEILNQGDIFNEIINLIEANTDVFADNGDGTFTHTSADGTVVNFDANTTTFVNNGDGTYVFTNANGDSVTVDVIADVVNNITNQGDIFNEIMQVIDAEETLTVLDSSVNDNGTPADTTDDFQELTYLDEDGVTTRINLTSIITTGETITNLVNNGDGTVTYTNEAGTAQTVDIADIITQEILNQGDIFNEIINLIEANTDVFADNGDGTFTHTSADGTVVNFDANTTTFVNNGDGTYVFTNANGDSVTVDVIADVVNNITNQGDIFNEIMQVIDAEETLTVLDSSVNDNGTPADTTDDFQELTYLDEDGVTTRINLTSIITTGETITNLVNNGDGTVTYTNEAGTAQTVDIADIITQEILNQGDIFNEIINLIEANTDVFADNGDGTFTHTSADGTVVNFDANTTTFVNNGDGTYVFTNANGDSVTVDVIADVVNNITNQGDIFNEITQVIDANETLTVLDSSVNDNGTPADTTDDFQELTYLDEDGVVTRINLSSIIATVDTDDQIITDFSVIGSSLSLSLEDGNTATVSLGDIAAGTDTNTTNVSLTEDGTNLILTDSDNNTVTLALSDLAGTDADTNTTNVSLTEDGTNLILTDSDNNTVTFPLADLAGTAADTNTTNVSLTEDGTNLILTDSDNNTVTLALSDLAGTDADNNTTNVTLATSGTDLVLTDSDNNTVTVALADIAAGVDTDDQTITDFSVTGSNLSITLEDGNTATVSLGDISAGTDTNTTNVSLTEDGTNLILTDSDNNTVTLALADLAGTDADTNTTNVTLATSGTDLVLTDSDNNAVSVALADIAAGVDTDDQTITDFSVIGSNLSLTLEDGNTATVSLGDISAGTDTNTTNVSLTEDGTNLILTDSDNNTVTLPLADLAGSAADTNTTNVSLTEDGTNLILTDSDNNTVTLALSDLAGTDADTNTTNVSLTEDGTNLILTDSDNNTVTLALADLAGTDADTNTTNSTLATVGSNLVLTDSDNNTVSVALADIASGVDTDDQTVTDFSVLGNNLSITLEDGNTATVALADIAAGVNTDDQNITDFSVAGGNLNITIEDGNTQTVPLTSIAPTYTGGNLINVTGTTISKVNNIQVVANPTASLDLGSIPEGIYRFDMSVQNVINLPAPTNPVDGGVYNFHFVGANNGTVTFPASFVREDGVSSVGSVLVPAGQMVTFYYYQGTFYTMEQ